MRRFIGCGVAAVTLLAAGCTPSPGPGGSFERLTNGNGGSSIGAVTDDGRYVVVVSEATDLTADVDLDPGTDLYRLDRNTGTSTRITNVVGPSSNFLFVEISDDGSTVFFTSSTLDVAPGVSPPALGTGFVWDAVGGQIEPVTSNTGPGIVPTSMSDDGHTVYGTVLYSNPGPVSGLGAWDRASGDTTVLPGTGDDSAAIPPFVYDISADSGLLLFVSLRTYHVPSGADVNGIVDWFTYDTATSAVTRITNFPTPPVGDVLSSDLGQVSNDGSVVYRVVEGNVVAGLDEHTFHHDAVSGITTDHGIGNPRYAAISPLGDALVGIDPAPNNGPVDLVRRSEPVGTVTAFVSDRQLGGPAASLPGTRFVGDADTVIFSVADENLDPAVDNNGANDVFIWTAP